MKSKLVKFEVEPLHVTDRAARVYHPDSGKTVWIPFSQCELYVSDEDANTYFLELPEWLAIEKELL